MTIGILYLVATPIGNLEDITLRAIRILREVDFVICEDSRRSGMLLKHLEIRKPLEVFHDHTPAAKVERWAQRIEQGEKAALISDAGTPVISDPGFPLIRRLLELHVPVESVPGPCALISALILSGLPAHAFSFFGYLPNKQKARRDFLNGLADHANTMIFYESPHRLLKMLEDVCHILGDRRISVSRELTKKFEETFRGSVSEALRHFGSAKILGELTVAVSGKRRHE